MGQGFNFDISGLLRGLDNLESKTDQALRAYAEGSAAPKLVSYGKEHAPWTDRSGDARRTLGTQVLKMAGGYRIEFMHGVAYGIWLELANEKRFAIIEPTIRAKAPDIFKGLEHLWDRMKYG